MASLQAVIFDYGGVLRREERAAYEAIEVAAGLPIGALWAAIHDIPEYRLSREGVIDRDAYHAAVRRALARGSHDETPAAAALAALDRYASGVASIEPEMRALLVQLRGAGRVKLGLLSNALRGGTARLRATGVTALFDDAIVSADVGVAKPDPAAYVLAATRLGVEPAACLMIDDQPRNIDGALAAGLRVHLHEPARLAELIARLRADGALG